MNVLYLDWPCFASVDAIYTLEQVMGYTVTKFFHKDYQQRISADFNEYFAQIICGKQFEFCFSFNYYPVVAENCKNYQIPYISIVYDCPYIATYSYTIIYPTNYVFFFDKQEYLKFKNMGINTVYYTVLPVNATIIDSLNKKEYDKERVSCDISFVGSLYNEEHNLFEYLSGVNDYTKGYLDAIMEAQLRVYGYNFLEDLLTEDILKELYRVSPYENDRYGVETPQYVYANYYLGRKITSMERTRLITKIGERFPERLKLFTLNKDAAFPHVRNMGVADYYSEMPYVFSHSKINLNITLKSIHSGIPLRCMDIMGNGGFLISNFQEDFLDYFVPDEDFVYYTDADDLLNKIDYYLSHEKERKEIAENGHQKVKKNHSFEKCFSDIIHIVFDS